jgi:hypothetical protein
MISRSAQDLPKLMVTFPTGGEGLPDNQDAKEQEQKNDSYTIQYKPLSIRICSRNDTAAKPRRISTVFINLSLQWPIVGGTSNYALVTLSNAARALITGTTIKDSPVRSTNSSISFLLITPDLPAPTLRLVSKDEMIGYPIGAGIQHQVV